MSNTYKNNMRSVLAGIGFVIKLVPYHFQWEVPHISYSVMLLD